MTLKLTAAARTYFGYFGSAEDNTPDYDPGPDAPCPFCSKVLAGEPVRTTSILFLDDKNLPRHSAETLSLFYRAHRRCIEAAGAARAERKELELLDLLGAKPEPLLPTHTATLRLVPLARPTPPPRTPGPLSRAAVLLARALRRRRPPGAAQ